MRTLVIDLGNSNITCGVFSGPDTLECRFRLHTNTTTTEDEYSAIFRSILTEQETPIGQAVLSSVVPVLTGVLSDVCQRLTGKPPILLGPSLYPYLPLKVLSPHEIGSDLVANALEAFLRCRQSCIAVDFGTALSFTAVKAYDDPAGVGAPEKAVSPHPSRGKTQLGEIAGVAISPGIGSAAKALSRDAAQLFEVELSVPGSVLGKNTVHALQAGVLHGYAGLVKHLVEQMKAELGPPVRVFATGGYSRLFKDMEGLFDEQDPHLTLYGLYHAYTIYAQQERGK